MRMRQCVKWGCGMFAVCGLIIAFCSFGNAGEPARHSAATVEAKGGDVSEAVQAELKSMSEYSWTSEQEFKVALEHLLASAGSDPAVLVREMIKWKLNSKDVREGMLPYVVIERLPISKMNIALGAIPLLSCDEALQEEAMEFLGVVDFKKSSSDSYGAELSTYDSVIRNKLVADSDIANLVEYMFFSMSGRDPAVVLENLATIYLSQPESESVMQIAKGDDRSGALRGLAMRSEWWIQYYVVAQMQRMPELIEPEIVSRLEQSEFQSVRDRVKAISGTVATDK